MSIIVMHFFYIPAHCCNVGCLIPIDRHSLHYGDEFAQNTKHYFIATARPTSPIATGNFQLASSEKGRVPKGLFR